MIDDRGTDRSAGANADIALSCDVTTLDNDQRGRRNLLHEWLQVGTCEIIERPDGYAFWLDPHCLISKHVDEFILLERSCCPFLHLRVEKDPEHVGPVLVMAGGEGVKRFVATQLGIRDRAD